MNELGVLVEVKPGTPDLSRDQIAQLLGPGDWRLSRVGRDGSLTYTKREVVEVQQCNHQQRTA
jgi:hypothetical protein